MLKMINFITTDLVILAINTLQVAMSKKYVANAFVTRYRRFLPVMDAYGGNTKTGTGLAIA